jgi:uncharacterized protein (TIGR03437 family)
MKQVFLSAAILFFAAGLAAAQCRVVNSASYEAGLPSGGALGTIFCPALPGKPGLYVASASSPLPFELAGLQVFVNRAPAPLLAVYVPAPGTAVQAQINFQVPLSRPITASGVLDQTEISISADLPSSVDLTITGSLKAAVGGFFSNESGVAVAVHAADNTPVTSGSPARPGETITVYANDFYPVWPPPPMGVPVPNDVLFQYDARLPNYNFVFLNLYLQTYPTPARCVPISTTLCSIAKTPAVQIVSRRLAPNLVGVEEIRFVVPSNQTPGDWALFFNAGSCVDGSGLCGAIAESSSYVKLPVR